MYGEALRQIAVLATTLLAGLAACSSSAVSFGEVSYPSRPEIVTHVPSVASQPTGVCPGSFRASRAGPDVYAAWWQVRPDSSSILMAGRSTDAGRTWSIVTPADTLDASRRGCDRPPPTIFADSATKYVDIAYFLEPNDGAGIFFTHSMDAPIMGSGDGIFHSSVAIQYGEQPARAAVTARGDDVVVAYEDPNAARPTVSVALSRTMGHIFENHAQVSSSDVPAANPSVLLSGRTVTVQWIERPDSVKAGGRFVIRTGEWR